MSAVRRLFAAVDKTLVVVLVAVAPADRHPVIRNAAMKRPILANVRIEGGIHLIDGNDNAIISNVHSVGTPEQQARAEEARLASYVPAKDVPPWGHEGEWPATADATQEQA